MTKLTTYSVLYFCTSILCVNGFIPHPIVGEGAQSDESITHTEITEMGFIRSLAQFFYDTRFAPGTNTGITVNPNDYYTKQHTIDSLFKLAYPQYNAAQLAFYSLPVKLNLDVVMTNNALTDLLATTKTLSAAHYDSEAFKNASRRIVSLRTQIVTDARDPQKDLSNAREKLGQLLHTLQDFYSHSNWVEMGKTVVNELIGRGEDVGTVAGPTQATCTNIGCTKKTTECSFLQKITLRKCPLVYYDCTNNILPEINGNQILTSGYLFNQLSETGEAVNKPANINKCSHGSVLDDSAHVPAIGGINKDSNSLLYSPHSNLHFQAVDFAVNATEQFLNELRAEIGNDNFDRLFDIQPADSKAQTASTAMASGQRFRFFTPLLSASLKKSDSLFTDFKNAINTIKSTWNSIFSKSKGDTPTYSVSDMGVDMQDTNNVHDAPFIMNSKTFGRKKRLIEALRRRA